MQLKNLYFYLFLMVILLFSKGCSGHKLPYKTASIKHLTPIEISKQKSGLELVDCIYVINLDERPEKWKRMNALFTERGLKANRVSAINGWNLSTAVQKELTGHYPMHLLPGEIGCLLSHLSVIKNALDNDFDLIWIMEDDVDFHEDVQQIPQLLKELFEIDPDWDTFYTDIDTKNHTGNYVPSLDVDFRPDQQNLPLQSLTDRFVINKNIMKIGQRFGNYSYLVTRKGMKKIWDYFSHVYLWSAYDIDLHYIPSIREYSTTREIVSIWIDSHISDTSIPILPIIIKPTVER
ncbi:MAG: glycosyltransferase family 25 protein [Chlamydiae bacterium]|nr:glycosyltransferase family 25 protein [Chlamydiota bacterium]